jgi:hypothetical protein
VKRGEGFELYPGMKKRTKKLSLGAETIRTLEMPALGAVQGGTQISVSGTTVISSGTSVISPGTSVITPSTSIISRH